MQGEDHLPVILKMSAKYNTKCADIVSGIVSDLCKNKFKGQIN